MKINEKETIKDMVEAGIYCLKIEDKSGNELVGVYLTNSYSAYIKVNKSLGATERVYLDKFIGLLKR